MGLKKPNNNENIFPDINLDVSSWDRLAASYLTRLPNANDLSLYPTVCYTNYAYSSNFILRQRINSVGSLLNNTQVYTNPDSSSFNRAFMVEKNISAFYFSNKRITLLTENGTLVSSFIFTGTGSVIYIDKDIIISIQSNILYIYSLSNVLIASFNLGTTSYDTVTKIAKNAFIVGLNSMQQVGYVILLTIKNGIFSVVETPNTKNFYTVLVNQIDRLRTGVY